MHKRKLIGFGLFVLICSTLNVGCIDGVALGIQGGVESAIASTIETLVTSALEPLLPAAE